MNYSEALKAPLKFSQPHEIHPDYTATGIAPRIGHALGQLSQENSDLGHMASAILQNGDHSSLKYLADKLDEDNHPLKDAFNWRHAERGINIDRALKAELGKHLMNAEGGSQPQSPGWTYNDWSEGVRGNLSKRRALREVQKHVPDATPTDVSHSILRLLDQQHLQDSHRDAQAGRLDYYPNGLLPEEKRNVFDSNARLAHLGQKPAPVHQYPDTRPLNKRVFSREGEVLKFSVDPTHSDFHKQMDENPEDTLTPLAYADYLQERGMEGPAEGIRMGVRNHGVGIVGAGEARSEAGRRLPPGAFSIYATPFMNDHLFHLIQKSTTRPGVLYHWTGVGDKDKIGSLVKGVVNSGGFSEVEPEDQHLYPTHEVHNPEPEKYSRLRSGPEYQSLVHNLQGARSKWHGSEPGTPFPTDEFLHAANYFHKAGDPRGEIIGHHADSMDGFKDQDPAHLHVGDTAVNRPISSHTVPLADGSSLFLQNHGHYLQPGVHAVSMSWRPKGVEGSFHAHFQPHEARNLADKFLHADPEAGKAIHKALDHGESKGNFSVNRFEKYGESLKYESYKAPAGGIVVDKLFYPGGALLPKLTPTKKFSKKKMGALKGKLKKLKGKTFIVDYGDSSDGPCS